MRRRDSGLAIWKSRIKFERNPRNGSPKNLAQKKLLFFVGPVINGAVFFFFFGGGDLGDLGSPMSFHCW